MQVTTWILIFFVSTSPNPYTGAAGVTTDFNGPGDSGKALCIAAGTELAKKARENKSHVLAWDCFKKHP